MIKLSGGITGLLFKKKISYTLLIISVCFLGAVKAYSFPWNFDMWIQPSILPYQAPVVYPELSVSTTGLRIKPQPREDFENIATSPQAATEESVNKGAGLYTTYCVVCHGPEGKGDGPVIKRGFYPLNLTTPGVLGRTDGYIYAYIRYGGKVMMPSYRESITAKDAWDVVNYVRKLQGAQAKAAPEVGETAASEETPESDNTPEQVGQDTQ